MALAALIVIGAVALIIMIGFIAAIIIGRQGESEATEGNVDDDFHRAGFHPVSQRDQV